MQEKGEKMTEYHTERFEGKNYTSICQECSYGVSETVGKIVFNEEKEEYEFKKAILVDFPLNMKNLEYLIKTLKEEETLRKK